MDIKQIEDLSQKYLEEQVELLKSYATIDSDSKYIEGNQKVVEITKAMLSKIKNIEIEEIFFEGTGTHLVATIKPKNPNGKIVLNAHLDTVFPVGFAQKYPPFIDEDNWLHGLGVGDCKSGIVVSAFAVIIASELNILPNKEIVIIYNCDEEIGSPTSVEIFKEKYVGAECAYVFELASKTPNGYGVVTQRRGVILGELDIIGIEAHAGAAYLQGHSANKELAHKILKLYEFNDYDQEIYYNAAPISGGRPNGVVSGNAHMGFCCAGLPTNESFTQAFANIDALAHNNEDPVCKTTVSSKILFPALEKSDMGKNAVNLAIEAGEVLGIHMEETVEATATDANWLYYYGVPAVDAFGPLQEGIHTTDEKVYIPSIEEKTKLFATMLGLMK